MHFLFCFCFVFVLFFVLFCFLFCFLFFVFCFLFFVLFFVFFVIPIQIHIAAIAGTLVSTCDTEVWRRGQMYEGELKGRMEERERVSTRDRCDKELAIDCRYSSLTCTTLGTHEIYLRYIKELSGSFLSILLEEGRGRRRE